MKQTENGTFKISYTSQETKFTQYFPIVSPCTIALLSHEDATFIVLLRRANLTGIECRFGLFSLIMPMPMAIRVVHKSLTVMRKAR